MYKSTLLIVSAIISVNAAFGLPGSGTETKATELRNKVSPCGTYAARRGRRSAGTGEAVRAARCMPLTS